MSEIITDVSDVPVPPDPETTKLLAAYGNFMKVATARANEASTKELREYYRGVADGLLSAAVVYQQMSKR